MVQASQIRVRFAAANASFRAVGEGRLAAAAEDELRAHAGAAVTAILSAARPAGGGQAPQPADEAATIERIAELAAALPSQPPQPRAPAGQVTTGDIIGHPGYRFQPFRVSAPPRHTDAAIEITGCLTDPSAGEPAGQITLTLAGHPDPVIYLVPPPARSLRSVPGGTTATEAHTSRDHTRAEDDSPGDIAQPAARHGQPPVTAPRPHADTAGTPGTGMTPGTATPGPSRVNGTVQPPGTAPLIQEDTMPPAPSATSLPPEGTAPADRPAPAAGPARAAWKLVAQPAPASQARPGSQPADDTRLLHELDHVLAAITERRRAAAAPPGTDGTSFADIRAAFTVLRHALDLPGPASNGDGARPAAAVPDAAQPASPPPGAAQDGAAAAHGEFSDIRAAFASLRDVLGLPAPGGQARPAAPGLDGAAGPDPAGCWTRPPRRRTPAPGGTATPRNGSGCPGSAGPRGSCSRRSGRRPGTTGPRSGSTSASGDSPGPWPRGCPWRSPEPPTSSPAGWSVPGTATRGRGGQPGVCTRPPRPSPTGS